MYYLPYLQEAQDIELVGEFVQTLKCLGHSENEIIIQRAIEYLLSCRHESGAWGVEDQFARAYHTTVCAIGNGKYFSFPTRFIVFPGAIIDS